MKTVIIFRTGALGTWREKYNGIASYAKAADWQLKPVDARLKPPDFRQLIEFWKPDGAIIDASGNPRAFDKASFGDIPVVVMNPESKIKGRPRPSVSSDSKMIAKLAASELLGLNPATLVFIEWFDPSIVWSAVKRRAMEEIARMHALPMTVITPTKADAESQARFEDHLAKALAKLPRPCGVFAVTDIVGAAAIAAAVRISARIPDDIAVVSVDDDPEICEGCSPTLSSVRPDFQRLGESAARLLDERMCGTADKDAHTVVPPLGVVHRASTQATNIYDRKVWESLELIRLKACDGIAPREVAAHFGLSRRMAEIRFKAATGKTIGEAILERRLAAACDYLAAGKSSVSAIANFCGWESDVAFRKAFKSRFGKSPMQWRSQAN